MYVAGLFADGMRPSSVFRYPSFCADANSCVIDPGLAHIKIINVRPLLVGVGDGGLEDLINHSGGAFSCELQDIHSVLNTSADYQLRNQAALSGRNRSKAIGRTPVGEVIFLDTQSGRQAANILCSRLWLEKTPLPVRNGYGGFSFVETRPGKVAGQLLHVNLP